MNCNTLKENDTTRTKTNNGVKKNAVAIQIGKMMIGLESLAIEIEEKTN